MNIFIETEGLQGEDLATAIIRVLLLRSQELRESLIRLVSNASILGPVLLSSHFSCLLQYATEDKASGRRGRLDLLIETDDSVIGIENKLYAAFQEGQPHKYLGSVKKYAEGLANLRTIESLQYSVVVIAPRSRLFNVKEKIKSDDHLTVITWEDVLEAFSEAAVRVDSTTHMILNSFMEFLKEKIAFIPRFKDWVPHLKRRFDDDGTPIQRTLVTKLRDFFPDPGSSLSHGETWVGYYFCSASKDYSAWYGYVRSGVEIEDGVENKSELIIATSFNLSLPAKEFRPIKLRSRAFLGTQELHSWAINYNHDWEKPEKWRIALDPLNRQVEKLIEQSEEREEKETV